MFVYVIAVIPLILIAVTKLESDGLDAKTVAVTILQQPVNFTH